MEDLVLSVPAQDAAFLETLASRMGWTMRKRRTSVERFINSCPKTPQMTDEERRFRQKSMLCDRGYESFVRLQLVDFVHDWQTAFVACRCVVPS